MTCTTWVRFSKMEELTWKFDQRKSDLRCMTRISQERKVLSKKSPEPAPSLTNSRPHRSAGLRHSRLLRLLPTRRILPAGQRRREIRSGKDGQRLLLRSPGFPALSSKIYAGHEYHYRHQTDGTGIAMCTNDFAKFQIIIIGTAEKQPSSTRVATTAGARATGPAGC